MGEPLLALVGPTGVGKTAVAVRLAGRLAIEAINADSRQVYRGLDVGTGKPTAAERAALRHHLVDVVDPTERYDAARFRRDALEAMAGIRSRGRLPVVVGGTGLYVRALLHGLRPAPPADPALRADLGRFAHRHGAPALHARLAERAPAAAARLHPNDLVRVVRALETLDGPAPEARAAGAGDWAASPALGPLLVVGLCRERAALARDLGERVREMVARGMLEEVRRLMAAGVDESAPAMAGIGYRSFCAVARGTLAEAEALRRMIRDTTRYAKRQMTWFRRDPEVRWIDVDRAGGVAGVVEVVLEHAEREGVIA